MRISSSPFVVAVDEVIKAAKTDAFNSLLQKAYTYVIIVVGDGIASFAISMPYLL